MNEIGKDPKRELHPDWGKTPASVVDNRKIRTLETIQKIRELILGDGHRIDLAKKEIAAQKTVIGLEGYETVMKEYTCCISNMQVHF